MSLIINASLLSPEAQEIVYCLSDKKNPPKIVEEDKVESVANPILQPVASPVASLDESSDDRPVINPIGISDDSDDSSDDSDDSDDKILGLMLPPVYPKVQSFSSITAESRIRPNPVGFPFSSKSLPVDANQRQNWISERIPSPVFLNEF